MSSEDNEIEKYFLPIEWLEMSQYEKTRSKNILENYQVLKSLGLNAPEPDFVKSYKKRLEDDERRLKKAALNAKKQFRVNEGASTSRCNTGFNLPSSCPKQTSTCDAKDATQVHPIVHDKGKVLEKSAFSYGRKTSTVVMPTSLSVRLDIEKYFAEEEWAAMSDEQREKVLGELENYCLKRQFGKGAEKPAFVHSYNQRRRKELMEEIETAKSLKAKSKSKNGKNSKTKKSSAVNSLTTTHANEGNVPKTPTLNETSIPSNESKTMEIGVETDKIDNSGTPKDSERKKSNTPSKNRKSKGFKSPLKETINRENIGIPERTFESQKVEIAGKKHPRETTASTSSEMSSKLNSNHSKAPVNEGASNVSAISSCSLKSDSENLSKDDDSKLFKIPAVPPKSKVRDKPSTSSDSGKCVDKLEEPSMTDKVMIGKKNGEKQKKRKKLEENKENIEQRKIKNSMKNNPSANRSLGASKRIELRMKKLQIIKEKEKIDRENLMNSLKVGNIMGNYIDQLSSMTFEETDDLSFTPEEIELSLMMFKSSKSLMMHQPTEEEIRRKEEEKRKEKEAFLEKKKEKMRIRAEKQLKAGTNTLPKAGKITEKKVTNPESKIEQIETTTESNVEQNNASTESIVKAKKTQSESKYSKMDPSPELKIKTDEGNKSNAIVPRYPKRNVPIKNYTEPDNIKMDDFIFCDICGREWYKECSVHGNLMIIPDLPVDRTKAGKNYAKATTPRLLGVAQSKIIRAGKGVWTRDMIKAHVMFGPYQGKNGKGNPKDPNYAWQLREMDEGITHVDASDESCSNWMRFVNCARNIREMNMLAFQYRGAIYYRTFRLISPHEELYVYYGHEFGKMLGIDIKHFRFPAIQTNQQKDVCFYCAECNGTFTSPLFLQQHEKACLLGTARRGGERVKEKEEQKEYEEKEHKKEKKKKEQREDKGREHKERKEKEVKKKEEQEEETGMNINGKCFTCNQCGKAFGLKYNLKNHIRYVHLKVRLFKCPICHSAFTSNYDLNNHKRIHSGSKPFKCSQCCAAFTHRSSLTTHIRAVHKKLRPFKCEKCDAAFTQSGHLTDHIRAVHKKLRPFKCEQCDAAFSRKGDLNTHIHAVHEQLKPFKCELCDAAFSQKTQLTTHIRAVHEQLRPFKCEQCDAAFSQKHNLTTHIRAVHKQLRPFKCEQCDAAFSQEGDLTKHIRAVHEQLKPFKCEQCDAAFAQSLNLTTHIRAVHKQLRPFKCEQCDAAFSQEGDLTKHIRAVHEQLKPFKCEQCDAAFAQSLNLTTHIRAVHKQLRPFKCEQCDAAFSQEGDLTKHIRAVHEHLRPFKCEQCDAAFAHSLNLTTHIRGVHKQLRPFKCEQCDAAFTQSCHLTDHIHAIHEQLKPFQCSHCQAYFGRNDNLKRHILNVHSL